MHLRWVVVFGKVESFIFKETKLNKYLSERAKKPICLQFFSPGEYFITNETFSSLSADTLRNDNDHIVATVEFWIFLDWKCLVFSAPKKDYKKRKENVKCFFSGWFSDHDRLVKNYQEWKFFQMMYNMTILRKNKFPAHQLWRHNILYLVWCLIFSEFWTLNP